MKTVLRILGALGLLALVRTSSPGAALAPAPASVGRSYIRLSAWAGSNHFSSAWLARDKTLQLSKGFSRLIFTVDAHEDRSKAVINGVQVSLSAPIVYQNGTAYISRGDLEETLNPILAPIKSSSGTRLDTICLDPGHGGKDPGFKVGSREEKRYSLLLAQELRGLLQKAGFKVVVTRTSDAYLDLESRPAMAAKRGADLFVSLHFNAFPPSTVVNGIETYCLTPAGAYSSNSGGQGVTSAVAGNRNNPKNILLAYQVQRSLSARLGAEDRGVKRARYKVLANATMPAILIEGGFMSNPTEARKIESAEYRRRMAQAIVDGILAYKSAITG